MILYTHNDHVVTVHGTHHIIRDGLLNECEFCAKCTCHNVEIIAEPCTGYFFRPDPPIHIIHSIINQASRYGEQVRLLEDAGLVKEYTQVRRAWQAFSHQLDRRLNLFARDAYYEAYSP
jgi:hypothetical protein